MFQRVAFDELVPGKKYKIGMFSGIFIKETWFVEPRIMNDVYMEFENVKIGDTKTWRKFFSPYTTFYQWIPQKEKIQWQMERRAVNLILRRLIGDEHFEW